MFKWIIDSFLLFLDGISKVLTFGLCGIERLKPEKENLYDFDVSEEKTKWELFYESVKVVNGTNVKIIDENVAFLEKHNPEFTEKMGMKSEVNKEVWFHENKTISIGDKLYDIDRFEQNKDMFRVWLDDGVTSAMLGFNLVKKNDA